jgi:hypothetical protein
MSVVVYPTSQASLGPLYYLSLHIHIMPHVNPDGAVSRITQVGRVVLFLSYGLATSLLLLSVLCYYVVAFPITCPGQSRWCIKVHLLLVLSHLFFSRPCST